MSSDDAYISYTKAFFKRWAALYDFFAGTIWYAYQAAVRELEPCTGKTVLDICSGTGEVAIRAARRGALVTAIDISPDMQERAKKKAKERDVQIEFQQIDARSLPFKKSSFDCVVISFGLHDMPRPVRLIVLKEAYRVCAGRLVILDYDFRRAGRGARVIALAVGLFESPYFKNFIRETAEPLFAEAGLEPPRQISVPGPLFTIYILEKPRENAQGPQPR